MKMLSSISPPTNRPLAAKKKKQIPTNCSGELINRLVGAGSALFGVLMLVLIIPRQTVEMSYGAMSPSGFPTFAAALIAVLGCLQAIRPTGSVELHFGETARMLAAVLFTLVAVLSMERFGFLMAAPLFTLGIMLFAGERRAIWLVIGGLLSPALIWCLFEVMLERPLP